MRRMLMRILGSLNQRKKSRVRTTAALAEIPPSEWQGVRGRTAIDSLLDPQLIRLGGSSSRIPATVRSLTLGAILCATPAEAVQTPALTITPESKCTECRIDAHLVATIHEGDYPGAISPFSRVTVTSDGRFLVGTVAGGVPYIADASGRIVRPIGRSGEGPGEFKGFLFAFETGNEYAIIDFGLARLSRFEKTELAYQGSVRVPVRFGAVAPLDNGNYFANSAVLTREGVAHPLHIVSGEGAILRSFGSGIRTYRAGDRTYLRRVIATSRDEYLWAAYPTQYRLEKWDTAGTLHAVYSVNSSWFHESDPAIDSPDHRIYSIHIDGDHVWAIASLLTADPRSTVIEVINTRERRVVTRLNVSGLRTPVNARQGIYLSDYRENASGAPVIDVWRFSLVR